MLEILGALGRRALGGVLGKHRLDLSAHLVPGSRPAGLQIVRTIVEHMLEAVEFFPIFPGTLGGWAVDFMHCTLLAGNMGDSTVCHKTATPA